MSDQPIIEDAVAIVPVRDVPRRWIFTPTSSASSAASISDDQSFAIAVHGEAAVHFVATDDADALKATANNISIYLWVRALDRLYENLKPGNSIGYRQVGSDRPSTRPTACGNSTSKIPDGCLLLFGEEHRTGLIARMVQRRGAP